MAVSNTSAAAAFPISPMRNKGISLTFGAPAYVGGLRPGAAAPAVAVAPVVLPMPRVRTVRLAPGGAGPCLAAPAVSGSFAAPAPGSPGAVLQPLGRSPVKLRVGSAVVLQPRALPTQCKVATVQHQSPTQALNGAAAAASWSSRVQPTSPKGTAPNGALVPVPGRTSLQLRPQLAARAAAVVGAAIERPLAPPVAANLEVVPNPSEPVMPAPEYSAQVMAAEEKITLPSPPYTAGQAAAAETTFIQPAPATFGEECSGEASRVEEPFTTPAQVMPCGERNEDMLEAGSIVQLHDLQTAVACNGQTAEVLSADRARHRYQVRLGDSSVKTVCAENVRLVSRTRAPADMEKGDFAASSILETDGQTSEVLLVNGAGQYEIHLGDGGVKTVVAEDVLQVFKAPQCANTKEAEAGQGISGGLVAPKTLATDSAPCCFGVLSLLNRRERTQR